MTNKYNTIHTCLGLEIRGLKIAHNSWFFYDCTFDPSP